MSVRVSYSKQAIAGIMLILVVLSAVEIALRIYNYEYPLCTIMKSDAYENVNYDLKKQICFDSLDLIWNYYPLSYIKPNQHFQTINIDSDGFRGPEIEKQKPENTYRIFVVGGSTTFGWGTTADNTTIPGYLQKDFNDAKTDYKVEVINAGIDSAFSLTESQLVTDKLAKYNPDLIIVYDGYNDIVTASRVNNIYEIKGSFTDTMIDFFKNNLSFYKTPVIGQLLVNEITSKGVYRSDITKTFDSSDIQEKVSLWKDRWSNVCDLGKKENLDMMITVQPFLGTGDKPLTKYEQDYLNKTNNLAKLPSYQLYVNTLDDLNNHCSKTADLRNVFDGVTEPVFYDYAHAADAGNKIVADKLFQLSMPLVQQKMGNTQKIT